MKLRIISLAKNQYIRMFSKGLLFLDQLNIALVIIRDLKSFKKRLNCTTPRKSRSDQARIAS